MIAKERQEKDMKLFQDTRWFEYTQRATEKMRKQVEKLDWDTFNNNSKQQIIQHCFTSAAISAPQLDFAGIKKDIREEEIWNPHLSSNIYSYFVDSSYEDTPQQIKGLALYLTIPFTGDKALLLVQPSAYLLTEIKAESLETNSLRFRMEFLKNSTQEIIQDKINHLIDTLASFIESLNKDAVEYNQQLLTLTSQLVEQRFNDLNSLKTLREALHIPLQASSAPSAMKQISIQPRRISPLSHEKTEDYGAYISDSDFRSIIESIRNIGQSMETNRAGEGHGEEALRDVILSGLSASIKNGFTGGELFRKNGKTDIAVPFENRAAFIAECKLWKGPKYIADGIDQLLGYLTWRDAKVSLIIFNKNSRNFSSLQEKVTALLESMKDFINKNQAPEGEWEYELYRKDDSGRSVIIHIFLFDLFSKKNIRID